MKIAANTIGFLVIMAVLFLFPVGGFDSVGGLVLMVLSGAIWWALIDWLHRRKAKRRQLNNDRQR